MWRGEKITNVLTPHSCVTGCGYSALQETLLARKFSLRQGLWTEGLRTPPGQECSNGSLTFFAVVLWRTFLDEIVESKNGALRPGH